MRRPPAKAPAARLNYHFAPVPRRAVIALRTAELRYDEFVILAWLYDRAPRATFVVRVTLPQVSEGVGWGWSQNWLSKRLRRLREGGWVEFESQPGRHRHAYEIRLLDARVQASEERPSTRASGSPRTVAPKSRTERDLEPDGRNQPSEDDPDSLPNQRQRMPPDRPSTDPEPGRVSAPSPDDAGADGVRAPQRGSEQDKPVGKGPAGSKEPSSTKGTANPTDGSSIDSLIQLFRDTDPDNLQSGQSE